MFPGLTNYCYLCAEFKKMGRIIAIDFGRKRTGIAVTDAMQIIATPLTTVATGQVLQFLKDYVEKNGVDCFVVGEPKQMNNLASESAMYIEPFIKALRKAFPEISLERMDERFTSKIAAQSILEAGLKKKDRRNKALVDTVSATLILQSFLESRSR